jgi:hypothetical protein
MQRFAWTCKPGAIRLLLRSRPTKIGRAAEAPPRKDAPLLRYAVALNMLSRKTLKLHRKLVSVGKNVDSSAPIVRLS